MGATDWPFSFDSRYHELSSQILRIYTPFEIVNNIVKKYYFENEIVNQEPPTSFQLIKYFQRWSSIVLFKGIVKFVENSLRTLFQIFCTFRIFQIAATVSKKLIEVSKLKFPFIAFLKLIGLYNTSSPQFVALCSG